MPYTTDSRDFETLVENAPQGSKKILAEFNNSKLTYWTTKISPKNLITQLIFLIFNII